MSYGAYLLELLRPLGVYDPEGPFHRGELESAGQGLDGVEAMLDENYREGNLLTAQSWGLERISSLLTHPPVAEGSQAMGQALAALLRIGGDGFTLMAINDTLAGCGVPAVAEETGVGAVTVKFPGQAGAPDGFAELEQRIREILPAHLDIRFWFRYITWAELEQQVANWAELAALPWEKLEISVIW